MLAETVADLIALLRQEIDDVVQFNGDDEHTLWSQSLLLTYCTEATDRVAKKTEALYRVLPLKIVAGQRLVRVPGYVRHIREARLVSTGETLNEMNLNDPARYMASTDYGLPVFVQDQTVGVATAYTRDYSNRGLLLNRTPGNDDTLEAQCSVTIAEPLSLSDDFPLTDAEDQRLVLTFMKARAYSKHDADTYDLQRALAYREEFESGLRERTAELRSVRRAPGTVRMEW